ncbi:ACP S-malonyltransferase [Nannocystis pusilla]|uniref:Malonyl CoA-acyl carrier protein transacylase n=1 Tax=Nannocystis pusilla TaxID=889268 RepID=A0ABS7U1G5_9BACT|nr:ACP S-malonyltransferase [Nannocystis pusilla]MBZ5714374.1 ACP S-malonyltransferase [Nannocystis pusilla]
MNEHVSSDSSSAGVARPLAFLFPGQGSQEPGMGKALAEAFPAARRVFAEADDALGEPLSRLCFEGPAEALAQTANTQPAILTCSIAAWTVVTSELGLQPAALLGHSLGEFSALVAAGALAFVDAVKLVRLRGLAMQEAVPAGVGAMAAVIGADPLALEQWCEEASAGGEVVSPANENGGGQIVIAGHAAAVERVVARAKESKARAMKLNVSAPFHCALMRPAAERVAEALATMDIAAPRAPVIANVDAEPYPTSGGPQDVRDRLVRQITGRVRWEASVRTVIRMDISRGLELGHGKVLCNLIKRIDKGFSLAAVGSPADLDVLKLGT